MATSYAGTARGASKHDRGLACAHDLAPALIAGHLSLSEAPAVAHARHAVLDRNLRIAGKQEVDVDRVTRGGPAPCARPCQHLGEQLAAEDPGPEVLDAALRSDRRRVVWCQA